MTKEFICTGGHAAGALGMKKVTVTTQEAQVLGKPHQIGTAQIGRVGHMIFSVTWDDTDSSISVNRVDLDGFVAGASASGAELVVLRSQRPNEEEAQMGCWPA
jgi:hypothetical protein